jgi:hypothetical protein
MTNQLNFVKSKWTNYLNSFLFLFSLLFTIPTWAQSPTFSWGSNIGGGNDDFATKVVKSNNGTVVVAGTYASNAMSIGTTNLTNFGNYNLYVAKFSQSGTALWAKSFGLYQYDNCNGISSDNFGNVYFAGEYSSSSITIGSIVLTNPSPGFPTAFVAKLDSNGSVKWAKSAISNNVSRVTCIKVDDLGQIVLGGHFFGSTITFDSFVLTQSVSFDSFIVKYDTAGNAIWAKSIQGPNSEYIRGISTDKLGNVVVTGMYFGATILFETITLSNSTVNTFDAFLAKYDSNGNILWAKSYGSSGGDLSNAVAVDSANNIIIAGHFGGTAISFGSSVLTNSGIADIFIAKHDSAGTVIWANKIGGSGDESGNFIQTDLENNVYTGGSYNSSAITFGSSTISSNGSSDMCLFKYDPSGSPVWAKGIGGSGFDGLNSVEIASNLSDIYLFGTYASGQLALGSSNFNNFGGNDAVLLKFTQTISGLETNSYKALNFSIFPNPNNGKFQIKTNSDFEMNLFNDLGIKIKTMTLNQSNNHSVNMSHLPKGVYFISGIINKQTVNQKLIITE